MADEQGCQGDHRALARRRRPDAPGGGAQREQGPASRSARRASHADAAGAACGPPAAAPAKSLFAAYALWLVGGWWGAHHLYLGRDLQAFVWLSTCGGFFLGWVRDLWRLPTYVAHANREFEYVQEVRLRHHVHARPPLRVVAAFGQLLVAVWFGELAGAALGLLQPDEVPCWPVLGGAVTAERVWAWLVAVWSSRSHLLRIGSVLLRIGGVSVGAWAAGNATRVQHAPFLNVLAASSLAHLGAVLWCLQDLESADSSSTDCSWFAVAAAVAAYLHYRRWSPHLAEELSIPSRTDVRTACDLFEAYDAAAVAPPGRRSGGRCWRWTIASGVWWLLFLLSTNYLVHCRLGQTPIKVSLRRAAADPQTRLLQHHLGQQWAQMRRLGVLAWWHSLRQQLDDGVDSSYRVLEFEPADAPSITDGQLRRRRNQLALKYHPDKQRDPTGSLSSEEANLKFEEVQKAYEEIVKARSKPLTPPR